MSAVAPSGKEGMIRGLAVQAESEQASTKVGRSKVWLHGRPADGETVAVAVTVHNFVVAELIAQLVRGIGAG